MTAEHMIPPLRANKKPYITLHEITVANLSQILSMGRWERATDPGLREEAFQFHPTFASQRTGTIVVLSRSSQDASDTGGQTSSPKTSFALERGPRSLRPRNAEPPPARPRWAALGRAPRTRPRPTGRARGRPGPAARPASRLRPGPRGPVLRPGCAPSPAAPSCAPAAPPAPRPRPAPQGPGAGAAADDAEPQGGGRARTAPRPPPARPRPGPRDSAAG